MDEKKKLIRSFIPVVVLKPMTEEAFRAIPQNYRTDGMIGILKLPFRVGRESRVKKVDGKLLRLERQEISKTEANNDLYLMDRGEKLNISREHFQIDKVDGRYRVIDRGSSLGTKVRNLTIGGKGKKGGAIIKDGDMIAIGCKSTPYVYQFILLEGVLKKRKKGKKGKTR